MSQQVPSGNKRLSSRSRLTGIDRPPRVGPPASTRGEQGGRINVAHTAAAWERDGCRLVWPDFAAHCLKLLPKSSRFAARLAKLDFMPAVARAPIDRPLR